MVDSETLTMQSSIRAVLSQFLGELQRPLTKHQYRNFLFGNLGLSETELNYKPEAYTRHNLVAPLLQAVNLQYQPEPRTENVSRPRWPDFKVTNTAIPYIGEIKPVNCLESGVEEVREYLSIDGFETPYGILTDGIQWKIYGPSERSKDVSPRCLKDISLIDALKVVAQTENYCELTALSGEVNSNGIAGIQQFESAFSRDRLDGWALERLTREDRREFSTTGRSLQSSLEGNWE